MSTAIIIILTFFPLLSFIIGLIIIKKYYKSCPESTFVGILLTGFLGIVYFAILLTFEKRHTKTKPTNLEDILEILDLEKNLSDLNSRLTHSKLSKFYQTTLQVGIKTKFAWSVFLSDVEKLKTNETIQAYKRFLVISNFQNLITLVNSAKPVLIKEFPAIAEWILDLEYDAAFLDERRTIKHIKNYLKTPNLDNSLLLKNFFKLHNDELTSAIWSRFPIIFKIIQKNTTSKETKEFQLYFQNYCRNASENISPLFENMNTLLRTNYQLADIKFDINKVKTLFDSQKLAKIQALVDLKTKINL